MKKFLLFGFLLFSMFSFSQIDGEEEVYLGGYFIDAKFKNGGID